MRSVSRLKVDISSSEVKAHSLRSLSSKVVSGGRDGGDHGGKNGWEADPRSPEAPSVWGNPAGTPAEASARALVDLSKTGIGRQTASGELNSISGVGAGDGNGLGPTITVWITVLGLDGDLAFDDDDFGFGGDDTFDDYRLDDCHLSFDEYDRGFGGDDALNEHRLHDDLGRSRHFALDNYDIGLGRHPSRSMTTV